MVQPPHCECPVCQKKFSKVWLVDEHVYQAHSDMMSLYQCNYCQLFFWSHNALKVHLETHKLSQDCPQYCCEECDALYTSRSSLKHHEATHNEPEYKCKICTCQGHASFFHTQSALTQHVSLQHTAALDVDLVCKECEKGLFWNAQVLKQHVQGCKHHEKYEGPFVCKWCKAEFSDHCNCMYHQQNQCKQCPG